MNLNELPKGYALPKEHEGKNPIHVRHVTIADGDTEPAWLALCTDGSHVKVPASALVPGGAA